MTDLRKAAEMALYALEFNYPLIEDYGNKEQLDTHHEAIMALCKSLAQHEQEPVAWIVRDQVDGCRYPSALKNPAGSINGESQPLYTAPPKREWVGLTDEGRRHYNNRLSGSGVAEEIEANLKEKNT